MVLPFKICHYCFKAVRTLRRHQENDVLCRKKTGRNKRENCLKPVSNLFVPEIIQHVSFVASLCDQPTSLNTDFKKTESAVIYHFFKPCHTYWLILRKI